MQLQNKVKAFLRSARVAHLATADANGQPHVIPICFAFDGQDLYSALDEKPKEDASPLRLKRVKNIQANPRISVIVDRYAEDWRKLAYVLITGKAEILAEGPKHKEAVLLLRKKYPQYGKMAIHERPIIRIVAESFRTWGNL